eukprot:5619494-Pleurochrysis_carterae.AAC.2
MRGGAHRTPCARVRARRARSSPAFICAYGHVRFIHNIQESHFTARYGISLAIIATTACCGTVVVRSGRTCVRHQSLLDLQVVL